MPTFPRVLPPLLLLLLVAAATPAGAATDPGGGRARKLLVVLESREVPGDARLLAALDRSGFAYELHEIAKSGPPGVDRIFEYVEGVILRAQPTERSRLGAAEAQHLAEFMMSQGRLFLFGAEAAFAATGTDLPILLLSTPNGSARADALHGVKYDLVAHGMDLPVEAGDYMGLSPKDQGEPVLQLSGDRYAAVKGQTCSYRLLLTSFQPAQIRRQEDLDAFIFKALDWFFGNAMGIGVLAPDTMVTLPDGSEDGLYGHFPPPDRLIVLEFFATWCTTCEQQTPILADVAKEYAGRAEVIGISYKESQDSIEAYLAAHPGVTWKVLGDRRGVAGKKYGLKALPTLFVIDRNRRVQYLGHLTTKEELVTALERCLRGADEFDRTRALEGKR